MKIFITAFFMYFCSLSYAAESITPPEETLTLSFWARCFHFYEKTKDELNNSRAGQFTSFVEEKWHVMHENPWTEIGFGAATIAGTYLCLESSFLSTIILGFAASDIIDGITKIESPVIRGCNYLIRSFDNRFGQQSGAVITQKNGRKSIHTPPKKVMWPRTIFKYGMPLLNIAGSFLIFADNLDLSYIHYRNGINPFGISTPKRFCDDDAYLCIPLIHPMLSVISGANILYNMQKIWGYATGVSSEKNIVLFNIFNQIIWGMNLRNEVLWGNIIKFLSGPIMGQYIEKDLTYCILTLQKEQEVCMYEIAEKYIRKIQQNTKWPVDLTEGVAHYIVMNSLLKILKNGAQYIENYLIIQETLRTATKANSSAQLVIPAVKSKTPISNKEISSDRNKNDSEAFPESHQTKSEGNNIKRSKIKTRGVAHSPLMQENTDLQEEVVLNTEISEVLEQLCVLFRTQTAISMRELNEFISKICRLKKLDYNSHGNKNKVSLGQYAFEPPHGNGNLEEYRKRRALNALIKALMHTEPATTVNAYLSEMREKQNFSFYGFIEKTLLNRD